MSYTTSLYHIVFSTKNRAAVLTPQFRNDLYRIIANIINKTKSKAILINGVENHIHILLSLSPCISLSDMVRDIKSQSSVWIKNSGFFPMFIGWEREYGAFSLSDSHKDSVYQYILNQEEHHKSCNLDEEYKRLVMKNGLTYYDIGR